MAIVELSSASPTSQPALPAQVGPRPPPPRATTPEVTTPESHPPRQPKLRAFLGGQTASAVCPLGVRMRTHKSRSGRTVLCAPRGGPPGVPRVGPTGAQADLEFPCPHIPESPMPVWPWGSQPAGYLSVECEQARLVCGLSLAVCKMGLMTPTCRGCCLCHKSNVRACMLSRSVMFSSVQPRGR